MIKGIGLVNLTVSQEDGKFCIPVDYRIFDWVTGLRKNRVVNGKKRLEKIDISEEGQIVFLRGYGTIRVFKFVSKNRRIDYFAASILKTTQQQILHFMRTRWTVETYHRELKQNNGISRCQAHTCRAQRNHIFLAISAWLALFLRKRSLHVSSYQVKWEIIRDAVAHALNQRLQIS